jgi:uncharacterized protein
MKSDVFFLPWDQKNEFGDWCKKIGVVDRITERQYVALKIHFGEAGNTGFVKPAMAREVVKLVKSKKAFPFLTDASTIYVGERADAIHHTVVASNHGFTLGKCDCPVIIADGLRGNAEAEVEVNLKHFNKVSVANAIHYADFCLFISHLKGHELTGFGGALKNIGMGCATRKGKYAMHDKVSPEMYLQRCVGCERCVKWCSAKALKVINKKITLRKDLCVGCGECILSCPHSVFQIPWDENTLATQEKIVEYAFGVLKNKEHFCINVVNHITQFCDCYPDKGKPLMDDIGILASADPVALDQASADIVNKKYGSDFWRHIFPSIDWEVQLAYAEKIGLGNREYHLL